MVVATNQTYGAIRDSVTPINYSSIRCLYQQLPEEICQHGMLEDLSWNFLL